MISRKQRGIKRASPKSERKEKIKTNRDHNRVSKTEGNILLKLSSSVYMHIDGSPPTKQQAALLSLVGAEMFSIHHCCFS